MRYLVHYFYKVELWNIIYKYILWAWKMMAWGRSYKLVKWASWTCNFITYRNFENPRFYILELFLDFLDQMHSSTIFSWFLTWETHGWPKNLKSQTLTLSSWLFIRWIPNLQWSMNQTSLANWSTWMDHNEALEDLESYFKPLDHVLVKKSTSEQSWSKP